MPRLYNENIMTDNRTPTNQQQWNTTNNQGKKDILFIQNIIDRNNFVFIH
jgi:hypothetical protein